MNLSPRKLIGLGLYFVGLGIWVMLFLTLAFWAVPTILLVFLAGWLTKTHEWPELKQWDKWQWVRDTYFGFKVVYNGSGASFPPSLPPEGGGGGKIIYAIYPHGHFSITAALYFALNPAFKHAKGAIHSAIFYIPIFGSIARWLACIPVTEEAMVRTLRDENTPIFMCPGGVQEIEKTGLDIVKRRGFLRVAYTTQSIVVPVWCPDERSYYSQYLPLGRTLSNILFFPIPLILYGAWWCPLLPKGRDVSRILVGKAICSWDGKTLEQFEQEFWDEMIKLQAMKK